MKQFRMRCARILNCFEHPELLHAFTILVGMPGNFKAMFEA